MKKHKMSSKKKHAIDKESEVTFSFLLINVPFKKFKPKKKGM